MLSEQSNVLLQFFRTAGGRWKYDEKRFFPEADRKDDSIPWQTTRIHFAENGATYGKKAQ